MDTKQQSTSIHPTPLTALSSLHISHLNGSHSLTSDFMPQLQRCRPLIAPWSTPGLTLAPAPGGGIWSQGVSACGTCLWFLLVVLARVPKLVALGTITTWFWHLVAGLCSTDGRVGACSCRQEPSCRQTAAPLPGGGAGHHLHHQLIHQTSLAANGQWQRCHCTAGGAP